MKYGEKASVSPSPMYRSSRRARHEASIVLSAVGFVRGICTFAVSMSYLLRLGGRGLRL